MLHCRHNNGSALTRKANRALREAGIEGVKVKCDGYMQGGIVTGPHDALIKAHSVLEGAGIKVAPIQSNATASRFYIIVGEVTA